MFHISSIYYRFRCSVHNEKIGSMLEIFWVGNIFGIELVWFIIITYRDGDNPDRMTPRTLLAAIPWLVQMAIKSGWPHKHLQCHNVITDCLPRTPGIRSYTWPAWLNQCILPVLVLNMLYKNLLDDMKQNIFFNPQPLRPKGFAVTCFCPSVCSHHPF